MAIPTRKSGTPSTRFKEKTEKMFTELLMPKTIMCVRDGFTFFNSTQVFPSKVSQNLFTQRREQAQKIIAIYGLSLDEPLPVSPAEKNQLWNSSIRPHVPLVKNLMKFREGITEAGLSDKDSFASIEEWLLHLTAEAATAKDMARKVKQEAKKKLQEEQRRRLGIDETADPAFVQHLTKTVGRAVKQSQDETSGFLYLKAWAMSDGRRWYKIGVTTDLERRDSEQNVLPVPATTLHIVKFQHIQHAKAAERCFHAELEKMRIRGARNKELFSLLPKHVSSIIAAMKLLGRIS
jgi:hypothetical protein